MFENSFSFLKFCGGKKKQERKKIIDNFISNLHRHKVQALVLKKMARACKKYSSGKFTFSMRLHLLVDRGK